MKITSQQCVIALLFIALTVFVLQCFRVSIAWIGVALYWAVLTLKNYVDLKELKGKF